MTIFVLLTAIVLVLLAVSIHLGAMRSMNALMPRWPALNFYRVGILILVAIIAHLLEISLFAIGLGWVGLFHLALMVSSMGRINPGSPTIFTTQLIPILRWDSVISRQLTPCGYSLQSKR
jgi:hypothetical protein